MFNRTEVILKNELQDPKGMALLAKIQKWNPLLSQKIKSLRVVDLFWTKFEGEPAEFTQATKDIWWDEVLQQKNWPESHWIVER
ncbi:MAG: hypothetical protein ACXWRA_07185, partial [Pseudobdellovibrionaceae bacterium]